MRVSKLFFQIFCILLCASTIKLPADYVSGAQASGCAVQSNGSILAAGTAAIDNANQFLVARYTSTGKLDTTFNGNGITTTSIGDTANGLDIALQSNGLSVVVGYTISNGTTQVALARYNTDGSLDTSFGAAGIVTTSIGAGSSGNAIAIDSSGSIVVAGVTTDNGTPQFFVARYTPPLVLLTHHSIVVGHYPEPWRYR